MSRFGRVFSQVLSVSESCLLRTYTTVNLPNTVVVVVVVVFHLATCTAF